MSSIWSEFVQKAGTLYTSRRVRFDDYFREINAILANLPGWERSEKTMRFGPYSIQLGFVFKG